jgi:hypothetical protein
MHASIRAARRLQCGDQAHHGLRLAISNRAAQQEFQPIAALAASRGSQLLPVKSDACGDAALLKAAEQPGSCFLFARRFPAATAAVGAAALTLSVLA